MIMVFSVEAVSPLRATLYLDAELLRPTRKPPPIHPPTHLNGQTWCMSDTGRRSATLCCYQLRAPHMLNYNDFTINLSLFVL